MSLPPHTTAASPSEPALSARQRQALEEVGVTLVGPVAKRLLAGAFLLTIALVPLLDGVLGERPPSWWATAVAGVDRAIDRARAGGWLAGNRELQATIHRVEEEIEATSLLRERLLPPSQRLLTEALGLGNEQAYLGRGRWLFFRADIDYVIGRGFLDPTVQRARASGGKAWEPAPQPDPLLAIERFRDRLQERGIELLVFPVPVKPTIHPEHFSRPSRRLESAPQNESYGRFLAALRAREIAFVDITEELWSRAAAGERLYLVTDTHWTPPTVELAAQLLASRIVELIGPPAGSTRLRSRTVTADGEGDIVRMLRLPEGQDLYPGETVTLRSVYDVRRRPWRADRDSPVLLLGDSFTNIYSDPSLGWGTGAGLAEQLSLALGRSVDRVALNAGGAYAARQALIQDPVGDRLAGKKVVVYQFAARELASGDWKLLER